MAQQNLTLRLAVPADARQIAFMSRDFIEAGLGWSWHPQRVETALRHRETLSIVMSDRGLRAERIAAFAIMEFGDDIAHLMLLAVRPQNRRTGLGRRMMEWMMESAGAAGMASIHLELRAANRAGRHFYRSLGFTESAYIPGYYRGREMALRMERELRQPSPLPLQWRLPAPPSERSD